MSEQAEPQRNVRSDIGNGPATRLAADVATLHVTLPVYEDGKVYAPPGQTLEVCVVGPLAFLDVCDFTEGYDTSSTKTTSHVMVDAWALLRALALQMGVFELIVGHRG